MRIGVLSDIHGNLPALEAGLAALKGLDPTLQYSINPSSVGMPRDGQPGTASAHVDLDTLPLTCGRAAYASAPLAAEIRRLGFVDLCSSTILVR